jgi:UDP-GlcNAc:undecaprenyl-phosphate/decaprenyl-phosphate GlcNAc-1-phosphate transferase
MIFLGAFILALALSLILTPIAKKLAIKWQIIDKPDFARKIHQKPIPLLGGVVIFIVFFAVIFLFYNQILSGSLELKHWLGFFVGALILILGGTLDDKYNFSPKKQIIFPILAIIAVLIGGVEIAKLSNPFGGYFNVVWLSPIFIAIWLMGMMYTTKLLDGVDGLVSGVSAIGALVIFLFTLTTKYYQPDIAFASLILAGAILGFLFYNWNPASIFLGEGGSLFLGFALGVLAIISGGKIAIALLVMGIPILDVAWTILRRLISGHNPFKTADKKHLHHRLLALGLNQKQTVLVFYSLSIIFGLSGLFLQSQGKFLALVVIVLVMLTLVISFSFISSKKKNKPSLLLHICCAPCSAYLIQEILNPEFNITLYFYNSNLNSLEEYEERLKWVKFIAEKNNLPLIIEPYNHTTWLAQIKGTESEPERGARCLICYSDRLDATAKLASEKKFNYFSTSLLVSPYKDVMALNAISKKVALKHKTTFLDRDFQINDTYKKSQELARKLGFYRQKFCGCEFSKR